MGGIHGLELVLGPASAILLLVLVLFILFYRKRWTAKNDREDMENIGQKRADEASMEDLMTFQGGEDLTICDILDAPGEVTGKSDYGTLYRALMPRSGKLRILRFLRPVCSARAKEFGEAIRLLGIIRHPNLVPLVGFYAGPRGEKLIVHPFYRRGNLAEFIRDSAFRSPLSRDWTRSLSYMNNLWHFKNLIISSYWQMAMASLTNGQMFIASQLA